MITDAAKGRAFLDKLVDKSRSARYPAYGRQILDARRRGLQPRQQMVITVFSWNLAKAFPRIVIDPLSDFERLDFSYLAGLDVIIGFNHVEASFVKPLARAMLKANPRRLQAWPMESDEKGKYSTQFFRVADGGDYEPL